MLCLFQSSICHCFQFTKVETKKLSLRFLFSETSFLKWLFLFSPRSLKFKFLENCKRFFKKALKNYQYSKFKSVGKNEKPLLPWKVVGWVITRKTLIFKGGWVGRWVFYTNHAGNRVVWQKWNPGRLGKTRNLLTSGVLGAMFR